MKVITPDKVERKDIVFELDEDCLSVFIGGSIEMGEAEDWQKELIEKLNDVNVTILNPRRDDWDSSWEQSKDNPEFRHQVEWELDAQDFADIILYYFSPGTKSPITLLELGMYSYRGEDVGIVCPDGFWRKGNVDIVRIRHECTELQNLDEAVDWIRKHSEDPAFGEIPF